MFYKKMFTLILILFIPISIYAEKELNFTYWGSTFEKKAVEDVIDDFNKSHPGVHVNAQHIPQNYDEKIMTMITGGNAPDVGYVMGDTVQLWANQGVTKNLSPYFASDPDLGSRMEVSRYRIGDGIAATNAALESMIIFYNKKLFDDAGVPYPPSKWTEAWKWDEFVNIAKKLTKDKNGNNALSPNFDPENIEVYGFGHDRWWGQWMPFVYSNGGRLISDDGKTVLMDQPETIQALQKFADLSWKHHVSPTPAATKSFPNNNVMLQTGKVAMSLNGHWNILDISQMGFEWGIGVLPYHKKPITITFGGAIAIFSGTKHHQEAYKLFKFFGDPDKNALFPKGLWMPLRVKDYLEPSLTANWLDKIPGVYPPESRDVLVDYTLISTLAHPHKPPSYWVNGWSKALSKVIQPAVDLIFANEATAQEAMRDVASKANPLLKGRL